MINGALIAAKPIDDAHYFIDLVGGAAVVFAAIAASHWLCRHVHADEFAAAAVPATATELGQSAQPSIRL